MPEPTDPAPSFAPGPDRGANGAAADGRAAGSSGNGHGAPGPRLGRAPRPGRPPGPSAKPAAVVFGIILLLFLVGFLVDELTSAPHATPSGHATPSSRPVPGTGGLVAQPASSVLGPLSTAGQPPANVVSALVVPRGTAVVPGSASQQGLGLYDATVHVQVPAAEEAVITFVRTELGAGRWHVLSAGPRAQGYQIVAQHPGSDGYEWEVGFTVSPTTFTSAVPGVGAPAGGVTPVALRLFAISDAS